MKKMNRKGFTLIELLAVIVILGLLMAIAIPSVTRYITQSRKKTLVSTIQQYVSQVTTMVNDMDFGSVSNPANLYYIRVGNDDQSCVPLERGGSDPFGEWGQAYVAVHYDPVAVSYDYYFTFNDKGGFGMKLTEADKISTNGKEIETPIPDEATDEKIKSQVELTGGVKLQYDETDLVPIIIDKTSDCVVPAA